MRTWRDFPLIALLIAAPLVVFVLFTFVAPRDYSIVEDDVESHYYYGARLLDAGQPLFVITHPGTPVSVVAALLLGGTDQTHKEVQAFFNRAHLLVAVLSSLAIGAFTLIFLRDVPTAIAALTLASILSWPSFLSYLDYYGTDSFVIAFGLPVLSVMWASLTRHRTPSPLTLLLCGAGLGLCLATKLSFVPVACAVFITCSFQIWRASDRGWARWPAVLLCPGAALLAFLICTAPIMERLPDIFFPWLTVSEDAIRVSGWHMPGAVWQSFRIMAEVNPLLALSLVVATGTFLCLFGASVLGRSRFGRGGDLASRAGVPEGFDYTAGGVFLLLMLVALAYTLARSSPGNDPGIALRNIGPSALVMPFLILFCYRMTGQRGATPLERRPVLRTALSVLALITVLVGVADRLTRRDDFIQEWQTKIAAHTSRFEDLREPGTRIAFWHDANASYLGEVSFHFTGNYQYGADYFDRFLLNAYPTYTVFRLPVAVRLLERTTGHSGAGTPWPPIVTFGWPGRLWRRAFPHPYEKGSNDIVAGESAGVRVSLIAFPASDELPEERHRELLSLVRSRLGEPRVWREAIGGIDWVLISVAAVERPEGRV